MTNLPGVTPVGHGMGIADGVLDQNASSISLFSSAVRFETDECSVQ